VTSIDQAAARLGLRSYDTALPQEWVNDFTARTGTSPAGRFVWSYDGSLMFGAPVALDDEARKLLAAYQNALLRG
jgi:hypothetical protein